MDFWVDGERDEVAEAVDGAAEPIEAGTEVGDGGRSKGFDEGENGIGLGDGDDDFGGDREVASESEDWLTRR